jgi:succinoglycan biosynthesis protein ExoM
MQKPDDFAIDVCVCTFRRAHIKETLRSLAQLKLKPGRKIRVVVIDNDETPEAREEIEAAARALALNFLYVHAPARNISIARNAGLNAATAPFIAFIDDDEIASPGWLEALFDRIETDKADAVLGPVAAVYETSHPLWLRRGNFHSIKPVWIDGAIRTGYTSNVLLRGKAPALRDLRFREELGRSGGEDTIFFAALHKAGGKISFAPEAVVTETVTPERARLSWLLKRRFRSGQTHGRLLLERRGHGLKWRAYNIVLAAAKSGFCFFAALLNCADPAGVAFWLLRGTMHAGVIARLLGLREHEAYGKVKRA